MTYILGLKQPGINAIIADCRRTNRINGTGENTALKTGQLSPGCIYGRTGNDERSMEFLAAFQRSIDGTLHTPEGFWQRFEQFVHSYRFPQGEHDRFKILLSDRVIGFPLFATLDSAEGLSTAVYTDENYIVSGGSGRSALDALVADTFIPRLKSLLEYLLANKSVPNIGAARMLAPYFLCLWLSELSLTFERSWLESPAIGVGGPFHFIYQTPYGEVCQKPAVYIFSSRDQKSSQIYSWVYRVVYVSDGIYVQSTIPPNQDQRYPEGKIEESFIEATLPLDNAREKSCSSIKPETRNELASINYYYFCGLGFTPPLDRKVFWSRVSQTGKREEIFNEDGELTQEFQQLVASNFEADETSMPRLPHST